MTVPLATGATRRRSVPVKCEASASVARMSYRRRAPGAAVGASTLYARIDPDAANVVDQVAERLGVSKAEFVETLMFHVGNTLDEHGRPPWWPKPTSETQELPMTG